MKKIPAYMIITVILALLLNTSCTTLKEDTLIWNDPPTAADTLYQNPVFEPDLADPTIVRAPDGMFYAYGTENEWTLGIERVVPIVKSKNLVNWEYVTDAFPNRPIWKTAGGIWAPDVHFINSKYYMYYAISTWGDSNPGIGLAISDLPYGPFVDQGKVFDSNSIGVGNSIDPCFIQIGSGRLKHNYLFWGSFKGIYGIELSADLKTPVGTKFQIANSNFEAAHIEFKNNKYYFFGSLGNCCEGLDSKYHVAVAVATDIHGPYLDILGNDINGVGQEGTLFLSGDKSIGWVGPGHNAGLVTDDNGNDYFIYHAIDITKPLLPNGATRRPLLIDRIKWVNGWPQIHNGVPSNTLQPMPYFK
ncbi:MAG: family 43 glycosylhydrolase [Bacteroidota bacterium]|nr:family 43 glycosylhydrolase [Bacteroidota bacterium]